MIRAIVPGEPLPQSAAARPCLGPQLAVDWQLLAQNPRMPYRFFTDDSGVVLEIKDSRALLVGAPHGDTELAALFNFLGTRELLSDGWHPPGWLPRPVCGMVQTGPPAPLQPLPGHSVRALSPREALGVLCPAGLLPTVREQQAFYTEMNTRCNHGFARIVGVCGKDGPLCTANAHSITAGEVYLADVATLPGLRGHGLASVAVGHLCAGLLPRRVTLLCEPPLRPFYEKLGFGPLPIAFCHAVRM